MSRVKVCFEQSVERQKQMVDLALVSSTEKETSQMCSLYFVCCSLLTLIEGCLLCIEVEGRRVKERPK